MFLVYSETLDACLEGRLIPPGSRGFWSGQLENSSFRGSLPPSEGAAGSAFKRFPRSLHADQRVAHQAYWGTPAIKHTRCTTGQTQNPITASINSAELPQSPEIPLWPESPAPAIKRLRKGGHSDGVIFPVGAQR